MTEFSKRAGMIAIAALMPLLAAGAASAQDIQQDDCRLSVFFPIGVSQPSASQRAAIVSFIQGAASETIAINGYASTVGNADANRALSTRRAQNVANVINGSGASIAAAGLGEGGSGPSFQRTDVLRGSCALTLVDATGGVNTGTLSPAVIGGLGVGAGLLLLLGDDSSSGTGTD